MRLIVPPLPETDQVSIVLAVIPPPVEVRVIFPPGIAVTEALLALKFPILKFPLLVLRVIFPIGSVTTNGVVSIVRFGAAILPAFIVILRPRVFS